MRIQSLEFTNHPVLKNLSLDLRVNGDVKDITLLIGENGCGKTILLEEIHKIFQEGVKIWNDGISRKITIELSEEEMAILSLSSNVLVIDYQDNGNKDWDQFKLYDGKETNLSSTGLVHGGLINRQFKCVYSTVEINFSAQKIDSVKATSIDSELRPTSKSDANLANQIGQLLVDIKAQDDAEDSKWLKTHTGQTIEIPKIEGKLDRFKKAYHHMFEEKELCDIRPEDGKQNIVFKDLSDNSEFEISKLSSGEKQVVYRVGYLLRNLKTISGGVVLIDEPELSLHPRWQAKYINFLQEIFTEDGEMTVQFIIATHSPYLLKNTPLKEVGVAVFVKKSGNLEVEKPNENSWSLFRNGPTIGEISYHAFHLASIEFHNELYGHIQEKEAKFTENEIESYFASRGIAQNKQWVRLSHGSPLPPYDVTPMTYIRNSIHHPENDLNNNFTEVELKESIESMIPLAA